MSESSISNHGGKGIELWIGSHIYSIEEEKIDLAGKRYFSAAIKNLSYLKAIDPDNLEVLLDSGAFSDKLLQRLTAEEALNRQLAWEVKASIAFDREFQVSAIASYDTIITPDLTGFDAELALEETIANARYLASQRDRLSPRQLILVAQGKDPQQYQTCIQRILEFAQPQDIIGFGGFAGMNRQANKVNNFIATIDLCFPLIASAEIKKVHLFGCTYINTLEQVYWLAEKHGLQLMSDSTRPIMDWTHAEPKTKGAKGDNWRESVAWWQDALRNIQPTTPVIQLNIPQAESKDASVVRVELPADCDITGRSAFRGRLETTPTKITAIAEKSERVDLEQLEQTIESHLIGEQEFYKLGLTLNKIKVEKLYKQSGYRGFLQYCRDRFDLGKTYVSDLIKAAKIYETVEPVAKEYNLELNEYHCRKLATIKNVDLRSQVLERVAINGQVTGSAIEQRHREVKLELAAQRNKPTLPSPGAIVRLTTKHNPDYKTVSGYWGVVTDTREYSICVQVLNYFVPALHYQEFITLDIDTSLVPELLSRLQTIYNHSVANDTVKALIKTIASRGYPYLDDIDEVLLRSIEQQM